MSIPNILTLIRILFIPLLVVCFYLPYAWSLPLTALLFALAAITDWLDGYLASGWVSYPQQECRPRRMGQAAPDTMIGQELGPVVEDMRTVAMLSPKNKITK